MPTALRIRQAAAPLLGLGLLGLTGGCAGRQAELREAMRRPQPGTAAGADAPAYTVAYPDRLKIALADRPAYDGITAVSFDGKVAIADQFVPVENRGVEEIRGLIGSALGIPAAGVRVEVSEALSRTVMVSGAIAGGTRHLPYEGPETVLHLIARAGGPTDDADLNHIQLLRSNVAVGGQPETLAVDPAKILLQGDPKTDVIVRPNDEIQIGENRRANLAKVLPRWMMPAYHKVRGWIPWLREQPSPEK